MKLLTQEIIEKLPPLGITDEWEPEDIPVIVKFFTPDASATWYITEGSEQENGDWIFFGLCDLGLGFPELGNVLLSELEGVRGRLGLPVERHLYWSGTLKKAAEEVGYEW